LVFTPAQKAFLLAVLLWWGAGSLGIGMDIIGYGVSRRRAFFRARQMKITNELRPGALPPSIEHPIGGRSPFA